MLELHRKDFQDMRWEEIWDASLRIRNMFLTSPMPARLAQELGETIRSHFGTRPVVVRSSAPAEDSSRASFAGLHESFVNVQGVDSILDHVRKVWASLWSDAALLYRQELGLEVETSTMAVAIQEIVVGTCSGVAFGVNPNDPSQAVIESVYGLNQGLVDGAVEPDRWILDREKVEIVEHRAAARESENGPLPRGRYQGTPTSRTLTRGSPRLRASLHSVPAYAGPRTALRKPPGRGVDVPRGSGLRPSVAARNGRARHTEGRPAILVFEPSKELREPEGDAREA